MSVVTYGWPGTAWRHGAPLRRIDRLLDIVGHASAWAMPRVVWRQIGGAARAPAPAPAFMFGGAAAETVRALFGRIDVPVCGCFALDDAAAGPNGLLVKDSSAFCGEAIGLPIDVAGCVVRRLNARSATTRQVSRALVPLFGGTAFDAAGLITDVLPCLWTLAAAGHRLDDLLMAVPDDLPDDGRAMLLAAGLKDWQLLPLDPAEDVIRAPRIIVPSFLRAGTRFSSLIQAATAFWTGTLRHALSVPAPRPARSLFLSPRDTEEPSGVADWQAIEAAAAGQGMVVVHPASLGLADRTGLYAEAGCLLGFDGAALTEACAHASPGIPVCVMRGGLARGAGTAALALALGHRVGVVFGAADQEDPSAPAVIEAEDRQKALACLWLLRGNSFAGLP